MSQRGYYAELATHQSRARAVGWENLERQEARYAWVSQHYLPGDTVLDLGAGLGDFGRYLHRRHPDMHYIGVEQDADVLKRASLDGETVTLKAGSFYDLPLESADLVVAIGCLVDGSSLRQDGVRFGKLRRLFERALSLARRKVVLVLLDQDALEAHLLRSQESALGGIRLSEVPWLAPEAEVVRLWDGELGIILTPTRALGL